MYTNDFTLADLPAPLRRLFLLWQASDRGEGVRLRDMDLAELTTDLDCVVLTEIHRDAGPQTVDFEPAFFGKSLRDKTRQPVIGRRLSQVAGRGPGSEMWEAYVALATANAPLLVRLPYDGPCTGIAHTLEVFLPLRPDEGIGPLPPRYALCGVQFCSTEAPIPNRLAATRDATA